jgi:hypothetical protein
MMRELNLERMSYYVEVLIDDDWWEALVDDSVRRDWSVGREIDAGLGSGDC